MYKGNRKSKSSYMTRSVLERLLLYYHFIDEHLEKKDLPYISSATLASLMHINDTQVRKDLAAIGLKGLPRVGFATSQVKEYICHFMGFCSHHPAVVIGAGHLGSALASYREFNNYGVEVFALFDTDPAKINTTIRNHRVLPIDKLEPIIKDFNVELAILAVPPEAAQPLADKLVAAGIRAIWTFSPTSITVPEGVIVRHEHLSIGLAEILYHLVNH